MKKFKHKKIETCKISKKAINTDKEQYAIMLDCEGDKITSIAFYKRDLLRDLIQGKGQLVARKVNENIINMAKGMLESVGIVKPVKVYEI